MANKINSLTQYMVYLYKDNIPYIVYKIIKLIGGITLMKQFLKRLFCKHKYKMVEGSECMIRGGMSKMAQFECKKCGRKIWDIIPYSRKVSK